MTPRASAPYVAGGQKNGSESPSCWAVVDPQKVAMTLPFGTATQQSSTMEIPPMIYKSPIPQKYTDAWFARQAEHAADCIAVADGRMTAEAANAKWYAILKKEREDEARQMEMDA